MPLAALLLALAVPAAALEEKSLPPDFVGVVQRAKDALFPKVVYIKVVSETYEGGKKSLYQTGGSGVLLTADGEVVTNHHVVDKAVSVRCILTNREHYEADVLGKDEETDLALLKLRLPKGKSVPAAALGDSETLQTGDFVMAMGSPFGLSRSVSFGIVSNPDQYIDGISEFNNWIQTDASINPGNSGGPLVDTKGTVIGINARGTGGASMGFAIPATVVKDILAELRAKGRVERGWSGIHLQALKDFERNIISAADEGVLVEGFEQESPAHEAGLKAGDRILALDGRPVTGRFVEDLPKVRRRFSRLKGGVPVTLTVDRDGKRAEVRYAPLDKGAVEGESFDCEEWMLTVKEINRFEQPWPYHYRKKGVWIYSVKDDGNADRSGVDTGDVVERIGGADIVSLADARKAYERLLAREPGARKVLVEVMRNGFPMKVVLDYNRTKASYEVER